MCQTPADPTGMQLNASLSALLYYCFDSRDAVSIFNSFVAAKLALCGPLSLRVLYLGGQDPTRTSTADLFTYHMAALELCSLSVVVFYFYGIYAGLPLMAKVSLYAFSISYPGEICFHCLTCVERYLAVVHPIFYRGLRRSGGVTIRNVSTVCTWVICWEWIHVKALYSPHFPAVPFFSFLALALLLVSFCSLSVLCVLIRPGPGDTGGDDKRVDQTKQRAFNTVVAILAVLWLWFLGLFVCFSLGTLLTYNDGCVMMMFGLWFCVPSSLVLPLLFLHRAGTLPCCR